MNQIKKKEYPDVIWFRCAIQGAQINEAACDLAREVKFIFKKHMDDFLEKDIDFFIVEVTQRNKVSG